MESPIFFMLCSDMEIDQIPMMSILEALHYLGLDLDKILARQEGSFIQHATLLCFAAQGGCFQLVNDLLMMGCNPLIKSILIDEKTGNEVREAMNCFDLIDREISVRSKKLIIYPLFNNVATSLYDWGNINL